MNLRVVVAVPWYHTLAGGFKQPHPLQPGEEAAQLSLLINQTG